MWVRGACIATRDFRERWKWDELSGNQTRRYRLRVVQRILRLPCTPSSRSLSLSIPFPLRRWALEAWIAWTGTKVWWLRGRPSAHCRARLRLACMMHAAGGIADPPFFPSLTLLALPFAPMPLHILATAPCTRHSILRQMGGVRNRACVDTGLHLPSSSLRGLYVVAVVVDSGN